MGALLDNFNRANSGNLGANWSNVPSLGASDWAIASNQAKASNGGTTTDAWNVTTFNQDQQVGVTVGTLDPGAHLWLLMNLASPGMASFTGYLLDIVEGATTYDVTLYRGNAGSFTTIVSTISGIAWGGTGTVLLLTRTGSDFTLLQNGTPVAGFNAVTDPSPLTGAAYIGMGANGTATISVDDFYGGNSVQTITGVAALTGTGTLAAAGTVEVTGTAALTGEGNLAATGHGPAPPPRAGGSGDWTKRREYVEVKRPRLIRGSVALAAYSTLAAAGSGYSPEEAEIAELMMLELI